MEFLSSYREGTSMPRCSATLLSGVLWPILLAATLLADDWSQFRGPNASGKPAVDRPLPEKIGPDVNVLWKTPLPPGHSSPVVFGDQIFLTAVRDEKLLTMALDRK